MRVALLWLSIVGSCAPADGPPQDRRQVMQSQAEIVKALRAIGDEALLKGEAKDLERQGYKALEGKRFDGLAIRFPARIDLPGRDAWPALIAVEQTAERAKAVKLPDNAALIVTRLGAGGQWSFPAYPWPANKNPLPPGDEPAEPPEPPGASDERIQGVTWLNWRDEREILAPGRYAVRIISAEWTSNTELVTLADEKAPPAVPRKITLEKGEFAKGASHPEVKGRGAALKVSGGKAFGSLRMKKDAEWPVTETGTAAIPATLALKRPGVLNPIFISVLVPVSDATAEDAQAWFTVDLRGPAGKYFVYLVAGEHLDGPHPWESK